MGRSWFSAVCVSLLLVFLASSALPWTPISVKDDPLVRMPGTQPVPENNVDIEGPNRCMNCHGGYDSAVEPAFNWQGSMMAQSARDFLFWSCMTVAAQDVIWAVGNPNGTDICMRCHFPKGWLEGRSDPTNASLMTGDDYDGVQCDVCHSMVDPFFETTHSGVREGSDWAGYWDETNASGTSSQSGADATYTDDARLAASLLLFDGGAFYGLDNNPLHSTYTENASGQMFVDDSRAKRASFADADARHDMFYSRYHKSKYFCSTCHDVSNPVLANAGLSGLADDGSGALITEQHSAASYFHVERTFSEFMLSAYGQQGGAPTNPEFQAQGAPDVTRAAKCQDCHMRDVVGKAASQRSAVLRPDESVEHPNSGQPVHDLTGGNTWVGYVLASTDAGSPNYDPVNEDLLVNQVNGPLTLDLSQGAGIDPVRLLAGVERAKQQLALAATVKNLNYDSSTGALAFRVQNNSGHKLISGFPEGRRMFVNVKAYAGGALIHEINPYDAEAATLKGLAYPYQAGRGLPEPAALGTNEQYVDDLVYEMKPSSGLTGEETTFHFVLADGRYKDNRIPPKGFRIAEAAGRLSRPVEGGVENAQYFTSAEYGGGYDDVNLAIPAGADSVEVSVYYQTTSREFIEFLRDEINGTGNLTLTGTGAGGDEPYLVQTDTSGFFDGLRAWGNTIWDLWTHNRNVPGAAPILMASASVGSTPAGCDAPTPVLLSAEPASNQATITWSDEHTADAAVVGYGVYYDQAGKSQLLADVDPATSYNDTNLVNGNEYCYKVTSRHADCESGHSNVLCTTPAAGGQDTLVDVQSLETGRYETTGKGKDKTTSFVLTDVFATGDEVGVRARVVDDSGLAVANASVDIAIEGPESVTLTTGSTDADGYAEAIWNTSAPKGNGSGGTTAGAYTAVATAVAGEGLAYSAELIAGDAAAAFSLQ